MADQGDNVEEILAELRAFYQDGRPVEYWFLDDPDSDYSYGYVAHLGDDFVLFARLFQFCWFNGFRAVRLQALEDVLPVEDESFIERAMLARNESIPPEVPISAKTFAELLECVCQHFPMVIVDDHPKNNNPSGVAGQITHVCESTVHLRQISTAGDWVDRTHQVPIKYINNVFFGSQYEETLHAIGQLHDQSDP